jgi:catalase
VVRVRLNAAGDTERVSVLWDEAVKICEADSDFHRRDLFEAITGGNVPEWELGFKIIDQETADKLSLQVAFCPSHVVPGIDFSEDPWLQGRLFSYLDTQLSLCLNARSSSARCRMSLE